MSLKLGEWGRTIGFVKALIPPPGFKKSGLLFQKSLFQNWLKLFLYINGCWHCGNYIIKEVGNKIEIKDNKKEGSEDKQTPEK